MRALLVDRAHGIFNVLPRLFMIVWSIDPVVVMAPLLAALAAVLIIRVAVALAHQRERARGRALAESADSP
jgi:predicted membrane metal-binding protein